MDISIEKIRNTKPVLLMIGNHKGIIQSVLDYFYFNGDSLPEVYIVSSSGNFLRYFFGSEEVMLKCFGSVNLIDETAKLKINHVVDFSSARRVEMSFDEISANLPNVMVVNIFAEDVAEQVTVKILNSNYAKNRLILGPASVGLLVPGQIKLGAIAGVSPTQLADMDIYSQGNIAIFSASGGMSNELINFVAKDNSISFALSVGGDRFPVCDPLLAFQLAEEDEQTDCVVYYGELGGDDEYRIVELIKQKKFTKKLIAYIGGSVSDLFAAPPQFGHAKALAGSKLETANAKKQALREVGAFAPDTFAEFLQEIQKFAKTAKTELNKNITNENKAKLTTLLSRKPKDFISTISGEVDGEVHLLGKELTEISQQYSFTALAARMLLGREEISPELEKFTDVVFKLLVDHGPYQSGVVNTMITARAGKDMSSSISAGLLTIGPRFGGAISEAASNWFEAVNENIDPHDFVEGFASKRKYISGIGHRKYSSSSPDPRLVLIRKVVKVGKYCEFASSVEKITLSKKNNLILNMDGLIAACLLDILEQNEKLTQAQIRELIDADYFNAYFILPRTVGFASHHLDQKRLGEPLYRAAN